MDHGTSALALVKCGGFEPVDHIRFGVGTIEIKQSNRKNEFGFEGE